MTRSQLDRVLGRGLVEGHRIRWFVYTDDGQRIPRQSSMRGAWPGYDAECSCGWSSRTGGGVQSWVEDLVHAHKRNVEFSPERPTRPVA